MQFENKNTVNSYKQIILQDLSDIFSSKVFLLEGILRLYDLFHFLELQLTDVKSFIFKNKHFIDASFLVTLAGYENALRDSLHRLPSTMYYCKSKVEGKALEWGSTTFDVLGILKVPLRVKVFLKGEEQKHQVVFLDDVVVLFQFCVPLHLSVKDPMLQRIGDLEMHAFKPEIFGKYKSHPWHAENFH